MALKFIDGFDGYFLPADVGRKWAQVIMNANASFQSGRVSGSSFCLFKNTQITTPNLGDQSTWTIGFGFLNNNLLPSEMTLLQVKDAGVAQVELHFNPLTGVFSIHSGGNVLGTGATFISPHIWYFVELKCTIDASSGTAILHINGNTELDLSGKNTKNSSNSFANNFTFGHAGRAASAYSIDDVYILDGTGGVNDTFLGDMAVITLKPASAGTTTQWTAVGAGSNWQAAKSMDDGYVSTSTVNNVDLYQFDSLPFTPASIAGVCTNVFVESSDVSSHQLESLTYLGSTTYTSSDLTNASSDYMCLSWIQETDPSTSTAWGATNVNGAQYGVKLTS